jgi:hypothetical protein
LVAHFAPTRISPPIFSTLIVYPLSLGERRRRKKPEAFVSSNPLIAYIRKEKTIMAITPIAFANVEVLHVGVGGPGHATQLFIVDGVAIINFSGANDDFLRDQVTFNIPMEGAINPADPALPVPGFLDSTVSVFPVAAQSTGGDIIGWAVDNADVFSDGTNVILSASVAIRGDNTILFRIGFHVSILST